MNITNILTVLILSTISSLGLSQVTIQAEDPSGCAPFGVIINVTQPTSGISTYSWTITTPSGSILTASSPQYISIFNTPGTYDVSLTINGSQTVTHTDFITVYARPIASFSVDDPSGCYPHCVQFSNTSVAGSAPITSTSWDFGNGNTSNEISPSYCFPAAGNFSPILSVADANGCFSNYSAPTPIQVHSNFPNASITTSTPVVCGAPGTHQFLNGSTGNSALSYTWSFGDGQTSTSSSSSINHTYDAEGVYQACIVATDSEQCSNEDCISVSVLNNPVATFTTTDNELCTGQPLGFNPSAAPQATSVQWDFNGDGVIDNTSYSPSFTYTSPGIYETVLIAQFGGGCSSTFTGSPILVHPGILLSISAEQTAGCSLPFETNITATVVGEGPFTYDWLINGAVAGNTPVIHPTFNSLGTYGVTLIVTNSNGCAAGAAQGGMIQISETALSFSVPEQICHGDSLVPTDISLSDGQEISTFSWDFDGDGIEDSDSAHPFHLYDQAGTYTVTLTVETSNGCVITTQAPHPVIAQAPLLPSFTSSTSISCAGEAVEFCIPSINGNTYSWNFHDQSGWITMSDTETCIEHMYEDTGYFDVSLSIVNGVCSLIDTLENYIYIEPPVALFEYSVDCQDLVTVTVSDQSIGAEGLSWDFGDGSPAVTNVTEYTHVYSQMGEYSIVLTATSSTMSCPDTKTHTLFLRPPLSTVTFSDTLGCGPLTFQLSENQYNAHWDVQVSNGDQLHIDWSDTQDMWHVQYSHADTTEDYYTAVGPFPSLVLTEEGCYNFTIQAVNEFGCPSSAYYENAVCVLSDADFADFQIIPIETCDSVAIQFIANDANIVSTAWTFNDGQSATGSDILHVYTPPYDYATGITATLSAEDIHGCTSVITRAIPIDLPAIPAFSVTGTPNCENTPISFESTSQGSISQTEWIFGDGNQLIGGTSVTHSYAESGYYDVCLQVTSASNGCVREVCSDNIVHINNPAVEFTYTTSINNCLLGVQFDNTTITDVASLEWDFGDLQTGSGTSTFHTYPLGIYDVVLTITNTLGCTDSLVVADIFNYSNIIGPYGVSLDETPCAPFHVEFSAFNSADTSFSYFWDFNDGNGDPTGSTEVAHDYLLPGTYCPQLIMTDENGCQVLVPCENPIVVEEFSMSYQQPSSICEGDSILFEVFNASSYSWNTLNGISSTTSEGVFYLHPEQSFSYLLTGTLDDCTRTDTIHVDVNALPEVSLLVPEAVCYSSPVFSLDGGSPIGSSGFYTVNGFPSLNFDPSMSAGEFHSVHYQFTDSLGCSTTAADSIFIHTLPDVQLSEFGLVCENSGIMNLTGGIPVGGSYYVNSTSAIAFDPSIGHGAYEVLYSYTDDNGCENSDQETLVVRAVPLIDFLFETICLNEPFNPIHTTSAADGEIISAQWQFSNNIQSEAIYPENIFFPEAGTKDVSVTFYTAHGCFSSADTTLQVLVIPHADFILEDGCQDTDLSFSSQSEISEGNIVAWEWTFESNTFDDDQQITYSYSNWGILPAQLVVYSNTGCSDTLLQMVSVYQAPEVSIVASDVCLNAVAEVYSNVELEVGQVQEYAWDFGDGTSEPNTVNAENLYSAPGEYTVSLTTVSNLGCVGQADTVITVFPLPVADFAIVDDYLCAGELVEFIDLSSVSSPSSVTEYQWYLDETLVSSSQNPSFIYTHPGHYHVKQRVYSSEGCIDDTTFHFSLQIKPRPIAGFHLENEAMNMIQSTVEVDSDASSDVHQWVYDMGDGQLIAGEDIQHEYSAHGQYTITQYVENPFGCRDTAHSNVHVAPVLLIYTPNAFTPDGNGNNDVFRPIITGTEVLEYTLKVFDRWGRLVFETADVEGSWNGQWMNSGDILKDGVYNWVMTIRSVDQPVLDTRTGTVTLLK